jgi:tetratricopeptide (TPR) repeat protein
MRTGAVALLATAGLLLAASLFFGGGSRDGPLAWIGAGAVLAATGCIAAALWGALPAPGIGREGIACTALASTFVAWNAFSILWSAAPDRSWSYFNRGLVYLAFGVVGAFVGSAVAPRIVAWLLGGLIAGTALWALAGKAVPALYGDYGRFARLRSPVGYWNALALVVAFGLPPALWAATRSAHSRVVRAGGVVVLYALLVALVLTYSRGGILAALVAIGIWLALSRERFESLAALVVAAVPAVGVLAVGLSLPGIAKDGQSHSVRVHDGSWFALAFVLGAAVAFAAAYFLRYRPGADRQRLLLRIAGVAAAVTLVVGVGIVVSRGNPLRGDVVASQSSRLTSLGSNNRWKWWGEAWDAFQGAPLAGTGAASFQLVHLEKRENKRDVTSEPHNLFLQFLAELGLVGFLLAAGTAGAGLLGAWRALQRIDQGDYSAAAALGVALPTFLVHGSLDYDWDFIALCGPVFFVTGFLLTTARAPRPTRRRLLWALAAIFVSWAALYSIAAPRVAARRVNDAYAAIERGSADQAVKDAKSAHSLDPVSVEPIYAWAAAEEARAHIGRAHSLYLQAVEVQPLNWDTWYELGRFELEVLGHREAARRAFERAVQLNPKGPAGQALRALLRST